MKYICFLRGVNVGGKSKVSMDELKDVFSRLGFSEVKTHLNSGNVIFAADIDDDVILRKEIEQALKKHFGRLIPCLLRSLNDLEKLVKADPFKGIPITKDTRLYVTFLTTFPQKTTEEISSYFDKDIHITRLTGQEICCAVTLNPQKGTTDLMRILEKQFGRDITTRNWNTVVRLVDLSDS